MSTTSRSVAYDSVKRVLDIVGASLVFLVSLPIQLIVSIAVARKLGRPVLFRQERPGHNGKVFTLVKFRTMRDIAPGSGLVSDEDRLTRFGKSLRSTSLDELPTLINVIRGDMSIVGPRPLLVSYLARYTTHQARRHEVRPGVTGLAQVSGRNAISWDQKLTLDVDYVERRSFVLDLKILGRTLQTVAKREGISAEGQATTAEFLGSSAAQGRDT